MVDSMQSHLLKLHQKIAAMERKLAILETREKTSLLHLSNNLIKNYPSIYVKEIDDQDSVLEWWTKNNMTYVYEETSTAFGFSDAPNTRIFKALTSAAGGYFEQTYDVTYERVLESGVTYVSLGCWVYVTTAGTLTVAIRDSVDGVIGSKDVTTTGAWQYVEILSQLVGDNDLVVRWSHSANAATFYVCNMVLNTGSAVREFSPRKLVEIPFINSNLVGPNLDPGGAGYASFDVMGGFTNPLVCMCSFIGSYSNQTTVGSSVIVRTSGDLGNDGNLVVNVTTAATSTKGFGIWLCTDDQTCDFKASPNAGDNESVNIDSGGIYWQWE